MNWIDMEDSDEDEDDEEFSGNGEDKKEE